MRSRCFAKTNKSSHYCNIYPDDPFGVDDQFLAIFIQPLNQPGEAQRESPQVGSGRSLTSLNGANAPALLTMAIVFGSGHLSYQSDFDWISTGVRCDVRRPGGRLDAHLIIFKIWGVRANRLQLIEPLPRPPAVSASKSQFDMDRGKGGVFRDMEPPALVERSDILPGEIEVSFLNRQLRHVGAADEIVREALKEIQNHIFDFLAASLHLDGGNQIVDQHRIVGLNL